MAYLVLAYPKIDTSDYDWIQGVRKEHDKRYYGVVEPHVTLVFATEKLDLKSFTEHVQKSIRGISPFKVDLNIAKVVENDSKDFFHAFLVPSQGFDEICKLHDKLYTGLLASELRHDIPFIPHVGIGTNDDEQVVEQLVLDITNSGRSIAGTVDELTIVKYNGTKVVDLRTIALS